MRFFVPGILEAIFFKQNPSPSPNFGKVSLRICLHSLKLSMVLISHLFMTCDDPEVLGSSNTNCRGNLKDLKDAAVCRSLKLQICIITYVDVSLNGGTPKTPPKWSFLEENPWLLGTTIFGNIHIIMYNYRSRLLTLSILYNVYIHIFSRYIMRTPWHPTWNVCTAQKIIWRVESFIEPVWLGSSWPQG